MDCQRPALPPWNESKYCFRYAFVLNMLCSCVADHLAQASLPPADRAAARFRCWGNFAENTSHRGHDCPVQVTLCPVLLPQSASLPVSPRAICRGNSASVLRIVPYAAIHFTAYESYRKGLVHLASQASSTKPVSPVIDLLAGSGAGASAVMITYPLDLVRTRLAYQSESGKHHSADSAANRRASSHASASTSASAQRPVLERILPRSPTSTIRGVFALTVKQEGFMGLYRGIGPTLGWHPAVCWAEVLCLSVPETVLLEAAASG